MYAILARKCVAQSVERDDSPRSGKVTLFFALRVSSNHFFFLFRFLLRIYIYICVYILCKYFFFSYSLLFAVVVASIKETGNGLREKIISMIKLNFLSSSYETRWFRKYFLLFFLLLLPSFLFFSFGLIFDKKVRRKKEGLSWLYGFVRRIILGWNLLYSILSLSRFIWTSRLWKGKFVRIIKVEILRLRRLCNSVNETHRG